MHIKWSSALYLGSWRSEAAAGHAVTHTQHCTVLSAYQKPAGQIWSLISLGRSSLVLTELRAGLEVGGCGQGLHAGCTGWDAAPRFCRARYQERAVGEARPGSSSWMQAWRSISPWGLGPGWPLYLSGCYPNAHRLMLRENMKGFQTGSWSFCIAVYYRTV